MKINTRPKMNLTPSGKVLEILLEIGLDPDDLTNVLGAGFDLNHGIVRVGLLDPTVPQMTMGGNTYRGIREIELYL